MTPWSIWSNHRLRGDYQKDFDKFIKQNELELPWEAIKKAYENEDINDNYLAKIFPKTAEGVGKVKDLFEAKEKFRSLRDKFNNFNTALGAASAQDASAVIEVLKKEGLTLAKEFDALKPYAEFIENTMNLIQLANEKDEMTKAMGAFGVATLRLNYHTYEAVRKDTSTGALSVNSPLVNKLMELIVEAIEISNSKAPGAFRPLYSEEKKEVAEYLVKYLNVQRAKYKRSEKTDSNWMIAHVSGVMAALFEQVYVAAITDHATPEKFLEFMKTSDKVDTTKPIDSYLDTTVEKKVFRDVRKEAMRKLDEAQFIVMRYSDILMQNSSYPIKEVMNYLEELSQKMLASANIDQIATRRYKELNLWQINTSSSTRLNIDTSYVMSFRDYQKALLNTDMINAENTMVVIDYYTAAVYDLIVRSALAVFTMSPNGFSAALGATATDTWNSLSDQVFTKLDDAWKQRSMLTAMSIAELALSMGATVMKEVEIANSIYNLIDALDKAVVIDPPLNTELITYSVKDVVIPGAKCS